MNQHPVKNIRLALGLSQAAAASEIGISRRALAEIEKGVFPRESTIEKIREWASAKGRTLERSAFAWRPEDAAA